MTEHDLHQYVRINDGDRAGVTAEVTTSGEPGGTARASLRAESGHITPGTRASLVDAVLDLPGVQESARLEAAIPLGDGESLNRLQERCEDVRTHPAGWSALLEATPRLTVLTAQGPDGKAPSTAPRIRDPGAADASIKGR
jgi:hypothetical protein